MDIKAIKDLAGRYTMEELNAFAEEFEQTGNCNVRTSEEPGAQMSDYLMAAEVRLLMQDQNLPLQEAVREFSKRVRGVLK
jgi:hypothetical protein